MTHFPFEIEDVAPNKPRRRAAIRMILAAGAAAALASGIEASAATIVQDDVDILNLLLNVEYLQAQFYAAASGASGIDGGLLAGSGQAGAATGGRATSFSDPLLAQVAKELAADQVAHIRSLRSILAGAVAAQPRIDLDTGAGSAFAALGQAAMVATSSGGAFDPYAGDRGFLIAAYFLEDIAAAAYRSAAASVADPAVSELITGLLATESHHAAVIRSTIHALGPADAELVQATNAISALRTRLNVSIESDNGLSPTAATAPAGAEGAPSILVSNIVQPLGGFGLIGRDGPRTLNLLYLSPSPVTGGGFFPAGVNGNIRTATQA